MAGKKGKKGKASATKTAADGYKLIIKNKRARFDYEIIKEYEAGLVLAGSEVKSLRNGDVQWGDAHAQIDQRGELWLYSLYIGEYCNASYMNHLATARRKLLLHRKELAYINSSLQAKGLTIIPLQLHFRRGYAKVSIALAKGKKVHDKRRDKMNADKDRDIKRAIARELK